MYSIPKPYEGRMVWASRHNVFSYDELDLIIEDGQKLENTKPLVGRDKVYAPEERDCSVFWLPENEEWGWVWSRIAGAYQSLNKEHYGFDLDCIDCVHLAKYETGGHYHLWHQDGPQSKLSMSISLSDPDTYEGGDVLINNGDVPYPKLDRTRGAVNVFPYWALHSVSEITKGTRFALVAWANGPAFR